MDKKQIQVPSHLPPVVTVVGHVDHGKTTLLDTIRKTSIADREHGGITQSIGASSVEIMHEGKKRQITLIDTPGHAAFGLMRGRGIQAADIGILVVSAVDGVMPQTKESIQLLKDTKLPFVVALTKVDLAEKQVEKVKQQLLKEEIMLEGLGGDVPFIEVSAKTGKNIKELLELVVLVFDMQVKLTEEKTLQAIIIESKRDKNVGSKATVVIKSGTIALRDEIICDEIIGKVRALINSLGKQVPSATVGDAVEIIGFSEAPPVGSIVTKKGEKQVEKEPELVEKAEEKPFSQADFFAKKIENELPIILVTDTLGSLEAIVNALPEKVQIIARKTGEISEADVIMAKSVGAFVIGFNTKVRTEVATLAGTEKVLMKNYTIIYELLDEVQDVLDGKALALIEKIFGKAKILAIFPFEKTKVCGVSVVEGRVAKGDKVRIMRGEDIIGEATIASVRQGKQVTSKVENGQEAGVIVSPLLDFTIGDMLIFHG